VISFNELLFLDHKLEEAEGMSPTPTFAFLVRPHDIDMNVSSTRSLLGYVAPPRVYIKNAERPVCNQCGILSIDALLVARRVNSYVTAVD
jgi:hypothetical protein